MRLGFRVLTTELKGKEFETEREKVRIGRVSKNDLVLRQRSVSRAHACIICRDDTVYIKDLQSKNATLVAGERVDSLRELHDGDFMSFGDVMVQIRFVDAVEEEDNDEETPMAELPTIQQQSAVGEREALGSDSEPAGLPQEWFAAPSPEAERAGEDETMGRDPVMQVLLLILALTLIALVGVFFVSQSGGPEPLETFGMTVRVGQQKVVKVPKGFVHDPRVEDKSVLNVERPMNLDRAMLLIGVSEGDTSVDLYDEQDRFITLRAAVLPARGAEVDREIARRSMSDDRRMQLARQQLKLGDEMEEESKLYRAKEAYAKALAFLEPFARNPNELYLQARRRHERVQKKIGQEWDRLTREMGDFIKAGDKRTALKRLEEARELIPDPQDVRRQNADLLFRLLKDTIKASQEAEGRSG